MVTLKNIEALVKLIEELLGHKATFKKYRVTKGYLYHFEIRVGGYPYQVNANGAGNFYNQLELFKYGVCAGMASRDM